jgi:hypothetical protein
MARYSLLILTFICILIPGVASAGTAWVLKKNEEGIKVYVANIPNSGLKAVKVECTINATMQQLKTLLMDAKAHEQWVYNTKSSYAIKNITADHQIYYSEISMPWPVKNRDVVVDLQLTEDKTAGIMKVSAKAIPGHVQEKDAVRIKFSDVSWTVTAIADKQLKIEYIAQADPAGSIPEWVTNMFCTKGPFETFKKLRMIVKKY